MIGDVVSKLILQQVENNPKVYIETSSPTIGPDLGAAGYREGEVIWNSSRGVVAAWRDEFRPHAATQR